MPGRSRTPSRLRPAAVSTSSTAPRPSPASTGRRPWRRWSRPGAVWPSTSSCGSSSPSSCAADGSRRMPAASATSPAARMEGRPCSTGSSTGCPSPSPEPRSRPWPPSARISPVRYPCTGCSRGMSGRARRWSRCPRSWWPSKEGTREPSWPRPRSWPNSTRPRSAAWSPVSWSRLPERPGSAPSGSNCSRAGPVPPTGRPPWPVSPTARSTSSSAPTRCSPTR